MHYKKPYEGYMVCPLVQLVCHGRPPSMQMESRHKLHDKDAYAKKRNDTH